MSDHEVGSTRNKVQIRRVLCIGGPKDGKWVSTEERGHQLRILMPAKIDITHFVKNDPMSRSDLTVGFPEYEVYHLERIALYGEGIWVGVHTKTLDKADRDGTYVGRDSYHVMVLRAILQRDVVTEMGL